MAERKEEYEPFITDSENSDECKESALEMIESIIGYDDENVFSEEEYGDDLFEEIKELSENNKAKDEKTASVTEDPHRQYNKWLEKCLKLNPSGRITCHPFYRYYQVHKDPIIIYPEENTSSKLSENIKLDIANAKGFEHFVWHVLPNIDINYDEDMDQIEKLTVEKDYSDLNDKTGYRDSKASTSSDLKPVKENKDAKIHSASISNSVSLSGRALSASASKSVQGSTMSKSKKRLICVKKQKLTKKCDNKITARSLRSLSRSKSITQQKNTKLKRKSQEKNTKLKKKSLKLSKRKMSVNLDNDKILTKVPKKKCSEQIMKESEKNKRMPGMLNSSKSIIQQKCTELDEKSSSTLASSVVLSVPDKGHKKIKEESLEMCKGKVVNNKALKQKTLKQKMKLDKISPSISDKNLRVIKEGVSKFGKRKAAMEEDNNFTKVAKKKL